jgi:hypothetical protein
MALKLGNTTASLYLGSTPVAAYLGTEQVYSAVPPEPATLYFFWDEFEEGADNLWTTVGNWWLNAEHTQPAGRLPTSDESVVASDNIEASGQTVANFTLLSGTFFGTLTVTGNATFNGSSTNDGMVTGNATFNDSSQNVGTVNGNATFNDSSVNDATVTGTATFTGNACNASNGTASTFVPAEPPSCP